jgi:hypothetical protein
MLNSMGEMVRDDKLSGVDGGTLSEQTVFNASMLLVIQCIEKMQYSNLSPAVRSTYRDLGYVWLNNQAGLVAVDVANSVMNTLSEQMRREEEERASKAKIAASASTAPSEGLPDSVLSGDNVA